MPIPRMATPSADRSDAGSSASARGAAERRLFAAVLHEAVVAYLNGATCGSRLARGMAADAERWLTSEDRSWGYLSFVNVCETLNLDVERTRATVLERRAQQIEGLLSSLVELHAAYERTLLSHRDAGPGVFSAAAPERPD